MKKTSSTFTAAPHTLTAAQLDQTSGGFGEDFTDDDWFDYHFGDLGLPPNEIAAPPVRSVAEDNGMGYGGSADDANTFGMPAAPTPIIPDGFRW